MYPQVNRARTVISLDGLWRFCLLDEGRSFRPGELLKENYEELSVPASYNDLKEIPGFRSFAGLSVYQRYIVIPKSLSEEKVFLRFEGVANSATIYLGNKEIAHHKGGFLPFEIELTTLLAPGVETLLTVLVDNRINNSTLPVGLEKGDGLFLADEGPDTKSMKAGFAVAKPANMPNFDFFNYCGINRSVKIYTTPSDAIKDITIITDIAEDETTGIIKYEIESGSQQVYVDVKDADGKMVGLCQGAKGTIEIKAAHFWAPGKENAYLYKACITSGNDYYEQMVGIRTVKVEGDKFLINGAPFYFKGCAKHEDSAVHGRGFDLAMAVKDVGLLHWMNANSVRTSHYPYAEEFYDLCDREGIVVIDETSAVGVRINGKDCYESLEIREHHVNVLTDLIARDKNHPCVVMWSLGNESDTDSHPKSAYNYWSSLYDLAHMLDPQNRPVTLVGIINEYEKDVTIPSMDVICLNRYYGWYLFPGNLESAKAALKEELKYWKKKEKPVIFTEYGAEALAGIHGSVAEMFSEEYQAALLMTYGEVFDEYDFVVGEQVWNFADFATAQGALRPDGNRKGVFTRDRRPKAGAFALKNRWERSFT